LKVRTWTIGPWLGVVWNILGTVLGLVAIVGFGLVYASAHGTTRFEIRLAGQEWLGASVFIVAFGLVVVLSVVLLVLHEALHGLAMRAYGGAPTFGVTLLGGVAPALYATAEGHLFQRGQYVSVLLAPLIVITTLGVIVVATLSIGGWLVLPLGLHTGATIGDLWLAVLVLRQPPGTRIEDRRTGVAFWS
jgi:hypothetical protein